MAAPEENPEPDTAVIQRILDGHRNAFEILVERYESKMIRTVSRRIPADDVSNVVQETFVSAYLSLKQFKGKGSFEGWLFRIAARECCNYWRRRETERKYRDDSTAPENMPSVSDDIMDAEEETVLVAKLLDNMSAEDRMLITFLFFEDMSLGEAAKALNWSYIKTKVRYFRARKKMRSILKTWEKKQ